MKKLLIGIMIFVGLIYLPVKDVQAKDKKEYEVPSHVLTIHKENTFPNTSEDQEMIEPSALTIELLDPLEITIENPRLIKLLNETNVKPSPISFGYRAEIYLGRWPLYYEALAT